MTTIFLIVLLITQVISFYFITLLYMKVAKFDDLERKQNQLMKEMDDAIAVYLTEIKDENEQLIEKLTVKIEDKQEETPIVERFEEVIEQQKEEPIDKGPPISVVPQQTMRHYARKSYENVVKIEDDSALADQQVPDLAEVDDDRTRALQLSAAGLSVEEIAKKLNKGTTEIELILKFS